MSKITKQLEEVVQNIPKKLFINGEFVASAKGEKLVTVDPRTGEKITEVEDANEEDVDRAVSAAREAFDKGPWPRKDATERARILWKLSDLVEERIDEIATIEALDTGKPMAVAKKDVYLTIEHFRYYAGFTDKIMGRTIPVEGELTGKTYREPIGVCAQIIPWNYPLLMLAWKWAPALACGNTVVMKVSQWTPLSALYMCGLAKEVGIPPGTINVITGKGSVVGNKLSSHPKVDKVAFTGSTEVGKVLMKHAAEGVKPVTLELGGKSPLIICADADVDKAAELAAMAIFYNSGQSCEAGSRTFVHDSIYDRFVDKAAELAKKRKVGDPFAEGTEQGPQTTDKQLEKILGYIEKGKQEGARLVAGGKRIEDKGFYMEPTVFADVTDDMTIAQEEIFGPVQSILRWSKIDEVIERANHSKYGLAGGVVTDNMHWADAIVRGVRTGTMWVNTYHQLRAQVPFGGYKESGIGREHGEEVLEHYTQVKAVIGTLKEPLYWKIM